MKKTINISGVSNVESYVKRLFEHEVARELPLKGVKVEGNNITFEFGEYGNTYSRIVVKQYSKKKYPNWEDFHEKISEVMEQSSRLLLQGIAETKKIRLAIFSETKHR